MVCIAIWDKLHEQCIQEGDKLYKAKPSVICLPECITSVIYPKIALQITYYSYRYLSCKLSQYLCTQYYSVTVR